METLQITIKDPKAEKLLWDLAEMDLIDIESNRQEKPSLQPSLRKAGWGKDIIAEVKSSFDDPLEEFDEGDGIARIPRYFGCGKGEMTILPSFDEPLDEFKEYE